MQEQGVEEADGAGHLVGENQTPLQANKGCVCVVEQSLYFLQRSAGRGRDGLTAGPYFPPRTNGATQATEVSSLHVCVCTHVCGRQKLVSGVSFNHTKLSFILLRQAL